MGKICKSCGAPIKPDAVKCICCGHLVTDVAIDESARYAVYSKNPKTTVGKKDETINTGMPTDFSNSQISKRNDENVFSNVNWKSIWASKCSNLCSVGIILTDTSALSNSNSFMASLEKYISYKSNKGIQYFLLDLKDQIICSACDKTNISSIIELLSLVYDVAIPEYLMIVGDPTVIPQMKWTNGSGDCDLTVPSDLPYFTLDTQSPWDGVSYDLSGVTQVGRIPTKANNNFAEAISYFDNVRGFTAYSLVKPFVYSAKEWEETSRAVFAHLNSSISLSPKYTSNPRLVTLHGLTELNKLESDNNLLCFNLHGSDVTHDWYGQKGDFYPEAFNQSLLPSNKGYVLMTEACYGARPLSASSIVQHAISNHCIAYVGSTMIAYGAVNGGMSCADVIANVFSSGVCKGLTVGKAFLNALCELVSRNCLDEAEIKTLAEFALYGDPSSVLVSGTSNESVNLKSQTKRSTTRRDRSLTVTLIPCNNVARKNFSNESVSYQSFSPEMQSQLFEDAERICKTTNEVFMEKFSSAEITEPSVYKLSGKEEYRAIYTREVSGIKSILNVHVDKNGNVKRVYGSK